MMLLKDLIKEGTKTISSLYPEREAREMVLAYLEHRIGTSRHTHIVDPSCSVPESAIEDILSAFSRMASGEPLQYVTGRAYFYGREFHVTPDVLIPRPETEILCRAVLDSADGMGLQDMPPPARGCLPIGRRGSGNPMPSAESGVRVLDLCTGSGCIAWTLALEMPGSEVVAADISDGALRVASNQDFADELSGNGALAPVFIKADVLGDPLACLGLFDVIVSNPPYVMDSEKALMRTNVLDHEPHLALFVPDDDPLLFYRAVSEWSLKLLKPGGIGVVEINEALAGDTEMIFRSSGFTSVHTIKDLNEKDRFVFFRNVPR